MGAPLEVVFLVGLPGAGKSTFFRERFSETHFHLSKDHFPKAKKREKRQLRLLRSLLQEGKHVVIDNTNAGPEDRALSIATAITHGARCIAYYLVLTPAESLARNEDRPAEEQVPQVGVYATAKRLRRPAFSEGFDLIYEVIPQGGTFEVIQVQREDESDRL